METAVKPIRLQSQEKLKTLLREHFLDLDEASHDPKRRVAWCTSVGPCEILTAMDFNVYFPENHGALLGARKISHQLIPRAVSAGYCAESCSYMNSDIGSTLQNTSPLREAYGIEGPPQSDFLVYNTNQCREVQDWWNFYGRRDGTPIAGICPPSHLGEVTPKHVEFVRGLLVQLIEQIESRFHLRLDYKRLEEVVELSSRASSLWKNVLDTAQTHPAPLTFFDGAIHMAPVILLRGSQKSIDYYESLLQELQNRVKNNTGAVPNEKFRIYWEGMPIWPKLRELSEKFIELSANVVASTYCNSWAFEKYDGGDPLEWMAKLSTEIFINRDENFKQAFLLDKFSQFDIDGAIFHNARTCPNNTNSRFGMPQRLRDQYDMPVLLLDGDLCDVRFFSTAQSMTNIEAFIEQLEERKK